MATPVLLTVDESPASLASVRGLRAVGYAPWVASFAPGVYATRSRAAAGTFRVPDPKANANAFAEAVAAAARSVGAEAVLPATEGSLRALTGRESLFDARVGTNPPELLDRATDKTLLDELAGAAGLETPRTLRTTARELDPNLVRFPAIVKPIASVVAAADGSMRSLDVERVDDEDALRRAVEPYPPDEPVLVQQWVEGTLAAVGGVSWQGDVLCTVHQESPRIWPPRFGISSFATTVPRDERVDAGVCALVSSLQWSGVFGVQFLRDGAHAYLIDLNPRIYGSIQLAIAAGCNLPAIWADLLLGREPRVTRDYRVGVSYRVEEDDLRAIVRARDWRGFLPRRRTSHAVFSWRDPAPVLATVAKLTGRLRG